EGRAERTAGLVVARASSGGRPAVSARLAGRAADRIEVSEPGDTHDCMASIQATRLRKGMLIQYEGALCRVLDLNHITPGNKRAHVQCRMRDIRSGRQLDHKFRA